MLLPKTIMAVLAGIVSSFSFFGIFPANNVLFDPNAKNFQTRTEELVTYCVGHICPRLSTFIVVNKRCMCSLYEVQQPAVEKRQVVEQNEANICAARVCPPRFGGILVGGVCECTQLVGLPIKPSTSTNVSSAVQPSNTPAAKRQEIVEEDEAQICAVRVCPPRFGGELVDGVCECTQLVGRRPDTTLSSTSKPTKTPTVKRQEIVEDEAIICARVCPSRFGAILVDGVCTCTRFGLPPPKTPVKRSSDEITVYKDCDTPCTSGFTGKLIDENCKCVFAADISDYPLFLNNFITKRQDVDDCLARICPPRFFSAPDGNGGCNCVQGTQFAPPSA